MEEKNRTTKNQVKVDVTDMARILRCATQLLKSLKATSKKHQEAEVARAPGEKPIGSKAPVEEHIVTEARTEVSAKRKILSTA